MSAIPFDHPPSWTHPSLTGALIYYSKDLTTAYEHDHLIVKAAKYTVGTLANVALATAVLVELVVSAAFATLCIGICAVTGLRLASPFVFQWADTNLRKFDIVYSRIFDNFIRESYRRAQRTQPQTPQHRQPDPFGDRIAQPIRDFDPFFAPPPAPAWQRVPRQNVYEQLRGEREFIPFSMIPLAALIGGSIGYVGISMVTHDPALACFAVPVCSLLFIMNLETFKVAFKSAKKPMANYLKFCAMRNNLHCAAYLNEPQRVTALVEDGRDVNETDSTGSTPLHFACAPPGTAERANTFFETWKKTQSCAMRALGSMTTINYTAEDRRKTLATVDALLEGDANLSIRNQRGCTPLDMIAVTTHHHFPRRELMLKLIQHGADQHIYDHSDKTLQHYLDNHPCNEDLSDNEALNRAFENLSEIPEELEEDETYPQFICPIRLSLVRDPVLDPTDGKSIYERKAICRFLQQQRRSPKTMQPLRQSDLLELPNLKSYIKKRQLVRLRDNRE